MVTQEAYAAYRFYVQIEGVPQAVFTELSGLQLETEVEEVVEGGNNGFVHKMPGRTKVGNITLKRGMTKSNELFKWYIDIAQGKISRRNVSVIMYDAAGEPVMRWHFDKAYPVKWIGPQFSASSNTTAIETLELAHSGLRQE
jgi:phage tail-like protein